MSELLRLAERVEREEPETMFWGMAYRSAIPEPLTVGGCIARDQWQHKYGRFKDLCRRSAYRDAAAMLMPEGWHIHELGATATYCDVLAMQGRANDDPVAVTVEAAAKGHYAEARARCAAALRARAAIGAAGGGEQR